MNDESVGDLSVLRSSVVVGDDGSEDSSRAVSWAREDAARRGTTLVVVRAWSITTAPRPVEAEPGYVPSEDEFSDAVRRQLASDLLPVLGDPAEGGDQSPPVVLMPVHRSPSDAWVQASRHAAVTVVGARGSGLARWLGSVSTAVVRSAYGPVVVIPHRDRSEG
jgi:nucleotide-binding universal stress UspA family protein